MNHTSIRAANGRADVIGCLPTDCDMVWLFERGGESLKIETLYDNVRGEYVVITLRPDGSQGTERFKDVATFQARLALLDTEIRASKWERRGPTQLKDGWNIT